MKTGIELISEERNKQIEKHQYSIENDLLLNDLWQLTDASNKLLDPPRRCFDGVSMSLGSIRTNNDKEPPIGWNEESWSKLLTKEYKERLIIAGALIAAEIDRLQNYNN